MRLETERLTLKPFRPKDADALQEIASNEAVALNTAAIPHPYPASGARDFIAHSIASAQMINRFGIFLKGGDRLIGAAACGKAATPSELAYMIHPRFWGNGYATEAARTIVSLCFEEAERNVIHSSAMVTNIGSIKVLEKIGFIEIKRASMFLPHRGREVESSFLQLARERWAGRGNGQTAISGSAVTANPHRLTGR